MNEAETVLFYMAAPVRGFETERALEGALVPLAGLATGVATPSLLFPSHRHPQHQPLPFDSLLAAICVSSSSSILMAVKVI